MRVTLLITGFRIGARDRGSTQHRHHVCLRFFSIDGQFKFRSFAEMGLNFQSASAFWKNWNLPSSWLGNWVRNPLLEYCAEPSYPGLVYKELSSG